MNVALLRFWEKTLPPLLVVWYAVLGSGLVSAGKGLIDAYWDALPREAYLQALGAGGGAFLLFWGGRFFTLVVGFLSLRLSGGDSRPLAEVYVRVKPGAKLWGILLGGILALTPWTDVSRAPSFLGKALIFFLFGFFLGVGVRAARSR